MCVPHFVSGFNRNSLGCSHQNLPLKNQIEGNRGGEGFFLSAARATWAAL